jgi:hypothetical protein
MLARHTGVPRHPATRRYVAITRRSDHHDAATVAWAALVEDPAPRLSVCEAGIFVHAATTAVAMCRNARMFLTAPRGRPASCAALMELMRVVLKSVWRAVGDAQPVDREAGAADRVERSMLPAPLLTVELAEDCAESYGHWYGIIRRAASESHGNSQRSGPSWL